MELWVGALIGVILVIINWIVSIIVYKKYEDKLIGKNWIIGLVGIVFFVSCSWVIAYFVSASILIILMGLSLPWWLNYMYYLGKQKRIKERIQMNEF